MELVKIIEDLEAEIDKSSRVPMTGKIFLDEDIILDYLDRIRALIPEEMRQAQWVTKERERILNDAQSEAEKIIKQATSYVDEQACNSEIVRKAELSAKETVSLANQEAAEIERQSKEYAMALLKKMEYSLGKAVNAIKEGQHNLEQQDNDNK